MNKRKAMIGYATYWIGRRMAQRVIRRQVKRRVSGLLGSGQRSAVRRKLPLVGAVAALAAAAAVVLTRHRTVDG
jgi:hypothetical protein